MTTDHKAQVEAARDECKRRTDEFAKAVLENRGEVRTSFREYDEHHARMAAREAIDRLAALASAPPAPVNIDAAAQRLMMWPLPKDFCPDCGISFDGRKDDEWNKNKTWPVGTNLFSVEQAKDMLTFVLSGAVPAPAASEPVMCAVAQVIEADHDELEARIRWLLNPLPVGAVLYEETITVSEPPAASCAECGKTSTHESMWALYCVDCIEHKIAPALMLQIAPHSQAASSDAPHPCEEAARANLLDELEDMRIELRDQGQETTAALFGKAIDWINGERDDTAIKGEQHDR